MSESVSASSWHSGFMTYETEKSYFKNCLRHKQWCHAGMSIAAALNYWRRMMEFVQLLQSIWLGLKGRSSLNRIVLSWSWIGKGLLKQWELNADKYGTAAVRWNLVHGHGGCPQCSTYSWAVYEGIVFRVEYWTHPVPINPKCINQRDHSSLWLDEQIVPRSARVNTCCKLTCICQLSTATAPNDRKQSRDPDQMLFTHCNWMSRSLKRDFGGDPVGQGGQWWIKLVVAFS